MSKADLVREYILEGIRQKRFAEGQKLPGCRTIARILSVNKITVNHAYQAMEEEHFLYCVPRSGYYVVRSDMEEMPLPKVIDFQTVQPDSTLIPYQAFTYAMNRSVEEYKKRLFSYESPLGLAELRETLREKLAQDGVYTSSNQIMLTNGAQQAIFLALTTIFTNPSKEKLLVEEPTYRVVLDLAKSLNIDCIAIQRDSTGINLKKLESIFQAEQIRAFYIIPRYHNPTGYSLTEGDKQKIADLCGRYRVLMMEDDYLADLGMDKRSLPLHYYDTHQLTVYIRSFSKTFLPGVRLGALVFPSELYDLLIRQKYLSDICTSGITQGALNFFITSGMYDRHIRKVNACYRRKLGKAKAILSHVDFGGPSFHVPQQGLFLWITISAELSAERIAEKLAQKNIIVSPYGIFENGVQGLRLCIAGVPEKNMDSLEIVAEVIKDEAEK